MEPQHPRVTLKDIARRARLSVIAVSMALRNHPQISVKTRTRVHAWARRLGYRRDPLLSALSAYRRGGKRVVAQLAYLVTGEIPNAPELGYPYQIQIWAGAHQEARRLGYRLTSYWLDPAVDDRRHSAILVARGLHGLLIAPLVNPDRRIDLEWDRFWTVAIGRSLRTPALHTVTPAHFHGMLTACRELEQLGYQRIGLVAPATEDAATEGRLPAALLYYQAGLPRARRVRPLRDRIWEQSTYQRWLEREKPDVVLGYGDGHYWWLVNSGRRVPQDVGYVLLSNESLPSLGPKCTAWDGNFAGVGAASVSLLHTQYITDRRGIPAQRMAISVGGTWVPGATTRTPPGPG